ncbi:SPOR domain-containing protein [Sphingomonas piscis]|uniref:SPOR domain-containing protein n=1 Tax=Sphingomonas piscis TaxID=2714943 RepID=A0A6G7YR72_9SPHN|nr:SPOR domain-containing protein [Sphingomonas piscis]QIK79236.1 SPOR domain-containing protein [Sphingomonas piscis]
MTDRHPSYDEQLPWLQPVEDEDAPSGISASKMLAWVAIVIVGAALIAGSFFLIGRTGSSDIGTGEPELIAAEPGPYKVKPTDPGGLDVAGESETAFQTSAGEDHDAQLAGPNGAAPPAPQPKAQEEEVPAAVPELAPEPATPSGGAVIQLGAFKNSGQAERAWAALSARFPSVAALNKMIVPFSGGVRLRASGASAKQACDAVRAGGENCFIAR